MELKLFTKFFTLFSFIAIAVSCLGLFGLTAFNIKQKVKEIGIRKVLGASVQSVSFMLTKSMIKLVVIASLIAIPAQYYLADLILRIYVYKTEAGIGLYILSFLAVLLISAMTVVFQSVKAASANPVNSLKYE